ncbi:MAG TPA: DndE family protein, partial [Opitutaceae bacterium]|nr:DndE family protein [Opitutaceae bacterium]
AGEYADVYQALLEQRAHEEDRPLNREALSDLLRAHLVRGVGLLTARRNLAGIQNLLEILEMYDVS